MSRRTPPAAMAASCRSSPTRRTLAPRSRANRVTVARSPVAAMPASSTMIRVLSSTASAQAGRAVVLGAAGARRAWPGCRRGCRSPPAARRRRPRRGPVRGRCRALDAVGPGGGQRGHGGGLAGPGRGDGQLDAGAGGGHLPHQVRLRGVEVEAVGDGLQQRQVDVAVADGATVAAVRGVDEELLVGQHGGGGVQLGAGDVVDAGAVPAAQLAGEPRTRDRVGPGQLHRLLRVQHPGHDLVDQRGRAAAVGMHAAGAFARTCRSASERTCHTCQVDRPPRRPRGSGRLSAPSEVLGDDAVPASGPRSTAASRRAGAGQRRRRRAGRRGRGSRAGARLRPARWPAAGLRSGVRAWRPGSPGWPAGPASAPRPGSAGGRVRPGTRPRARPGGRRSGLAAWTTPRPAPRVRR